MQYLSLLIISIALIYIPSTSAEEAGLLSDWAGLRSFAGSAGITPSAVYTADFARPLQGGDDNASVFMGNIDITFEVDLARAVALPGAQMFVYLIGDHGSVSGNGDFLGDKIGSAQTVSNIEAPNAAKLYEFWYEQHLFESGSVRAGLYDLNSEFDVIDAAGTFINSSFGIGPDFSQTGKNGPSIFPVTSLAIRLRYQNAQGVYAQAAVFDGVPGDPEHEHGTHVKLEHGDGVLQVIEIGLIRPAAPARHLHKLALGAWQYNPDQPVLLSDPDTAQKRKKNRGVYALVEYHVFHEHSDPEQGVTLFLRHGMAESAINAINRYTGMGMNWRGLINDRDDDALVFGIADAAFGDDFLSIERDGGVDMSRHERVYEISYRAQIAPWLALQPDFQFIEHPAFNETSNTVTVALLRAEIVF